jgi:V/A-type H+-transporting ATPase subunit I
VIVQMSKIEVLGPKHLLVPVLETIQRHELMQVDGSIQHRFKEGAERQLAPFVAGKTCCDERERCATLREQVGRLLSLLPPVPARTTYLPPERALDVVAEQIEKRLASCEEQVRRRQQLTEEATRLQQALVFLETVASLVDQNEGTEGREYIGVAVKDAAALQRLRQAVAGLPYRSDIRATQAPDGSYIGLLTTEGGFAETLKEALDKEWLPEMRLPPYLEGRPLPEKVAVVRQRLLEASGEAAHIEEQLRRFATAWRGLYEQVQHWLDARLAVLDVQNEAFATERCFVLFGWTPKASVPALKAAIQQEHGDEVIVQERLLLPEDLAHVPVALENRSYFKPYELLVSLLPPPRYTSFDPTPFIAVSFPFFFGVILGDIGYGSVLLLVALALLRFARPRPVVRDACHMLVTASIWSIAFGVGYGELFGEAGAHLVGMTPMLDRRTAIVPTLYFAVALGAAHVTLGLVLGVLTARRSNHPRETLFRLCNVFTLFFLLVGAASYWMGAPGWLPRACFIAAAMMVPLMAMTGGPLAPLEFVRHLGNIMSYARLMAVGLASALLAYVANDLATAIESVWLGAAIALLLHAFNLVLGVFAPAVHALRLHYVEFFSKFFEPGGRRYRPLKQAH